MIVEEVERSALKLNAIDRVHLAETLLDSLDKTDEQNILITKYSYYKIFLLQNILFTCIAHQHRNPTYYMERAD